MHYAGEPFIHDAVIPRIDTRLPNMVLRYRHMEQLDLDRKYWPGHSQSRQTHASQILATKSRYQKLPMLGTL